MALFVGAIVCGSFVYGSSALAAYNLEWEYEVSGTDTSEYFCDPSVGSGYTLGRTWLNPGNPFGLTKVSFTSVFDFNARYGNIGLKIWTGSAPLTLVSESDAVVNWDDSDTDEHQIEFIFDSPVFLGTNTYYFELTGIQTIDCPNPLYLKTSDYQSYEDSTGKLHYVLLSNEDDESYWTDMEKDLEMKLYSGGEDTATSTTGGLTEEENEWLGLIKQSAQELVFAFSILNFLLVGWGAFKLSRILEKYER